VLPASSAAIYGARGTGTGRGLERAGRSYRYGGSGFIEEIKNSSILQHQPILQAIVEQATKENTLAGRSSNNQSCRQLLSR